MKEQWGERKGLERRELNWTAEKIGEREETTSTNKGEMRTNMEKEKESIILLKLFAKFKPQRNGKHLRQGIPERQKREMRSKWICTIFVNWFHGSHSLVLNLSGYVRLVVSIFLPEEQGVSIFAVSNTFKFPRKS